MPTCIFVVGHMENRNAVTDPFFLRNDRDEYSFVKNKIHIDFSIFL